MSWIILFLAGLFEVGWAVGLKYTDGFTRPIPTLLTVGAMIVSLGLLGLAMKELPLGTAYAIWTGVGAVGTVIAGIILFGESMALMRLASVALIVIGVPGLQLHPRPPSGGLFSLQLHSARIATQPAALLLQHQPPGVRRQRLADDQGNARPEAAGQP